MILFLLQLGLTHPGIKGAGVMEMASLIITQWYSLVEVLLSIPAHLEVLVSKEVMLPQKIQQ